jgi:hypothetical protein
MRLPVRQDGVLAADHDPLAARHLSAVPREAAGVMTFAPNKPPRYPRPTPGPAGSAQRSWYNRWRYWWMPGVKERMNQNERNRYKKDKAYRELALTRSREQNAKSRPMRIKLAKQRLRAQQTAAQQLREARKILVEMSVGQKDARAIAFVRKYPL